MITNTATKKAAYDLNIDYLTATAATTSGGHAVDRATLTVTARNARTGALVRTLTIATGANGSVQRCLAAKKPLRSDEVVRRGRTIGYVECNITDEENRLVAKAASTCMVLRDPKGAGR